MNKIRVLIVDDSAAMRQLLTAILSSDPGIEVIGVATDPFMARDKIKALSPDVITLDVEMPRMDGLSFLEKLMRGRPTPVVMISSLTQKGCDTTMRALELGAVDFVPKPTIDTLEGVKHSSEEIISKVKSASLARALAPKISLGPAKRLTSVHSLNLTHKVIAIGASTGGTEAIREVLTALPAGSPGVVVVQHMPPGFTRSFADRLDSLCEIRVKEAEDGDRILPGHALIAPGDFHTLVVRSGAYMSVKVVHSDAVNRHRPSVDVMFDSCAETLGPNVVAAILTGMGADGALGMKRMRDAGARTIAQDQNSCVVFGMPKEAIAAGGAELVLPLDQIAERLLSLAA